MRSQSLEVTKFNFFNMCLKKQLLQALPKPWMQSPPIPVHLQLNAQRDFPVPACFLLSGVDAKWEFISFQLTHVFWPHSLQPPHFHWSTPENAIFIGDNRPNGHNGTSTPTPTYRNTVLAVPLLSSAAKGRRNLLLLSTWSRSGSPLLIALQSVRVHALRHAGASSQISLLPLLLSHRGFGEVTCWWMCNDQSGGGSPDL